MVAVSCCDGSQQAVETYAVPLPPPAVLDTIGRDDSIYLSLKNHGVSDLQIVLLDRALRRVFNASSDVRPGDSYRLARDGAGDLVRFEYEPSNYPERIFVVERDSLAVLNASVVVLHLDTTLAAISVTIEDNLANAISSAGESDRLTDIVADEIFGSVIDFHKDPRRGDRLDLVFRKLFRDGRFIRYGRVDLAEYHGEVVAQLAVYHADAEGGGYFDESGKSVERMFLLSPLSYRRISSGFSQRRFHPILRKNVPHLGMDFAADTGTRVWATARGKVVFAGRKGGYGKLVELEHPNGYTTRYAHLSRIDVRSGRRVDKFDVIGRVGATGRATGPHLHYELLRNGHHRNPARVNRGIRGAPIGSDDLAAFAARRDRLIALVRSANGVDVAAANETSDVETSDAETSSIY